MRELTVGRDQLANLSREVLARGGVFRFRARGGSMRPFLEEGDVLTVEPVGAAGVRRGDVVVHAEPEGRTLVHRVVGVVRRGGERVLLVRGDAQTGDPWEVPFRDVAGRVAMSGREGAGHRPLGNSRRLLALLWVHAAPLGPSLLAWGARARGLGSRGLSGMQRTRAYRLAARVLLRGGVVCRRGVLADTRGLAALYGPRGSVWSRGSVDGWDDPLREEAEGVVVVVAAAGSRIVGAVCVHRDEEGDGPDCWRMTGMHVKKAWRGAGIGGRLAREALRAAAAGGAGSVLLEVSRGNTAACRLYEKAGFSVDPASTRNPGMVSFRASCRR